MNPLFSIARIRRHGRLLTGFLFLILGASCNPSAPIREPSLESLVGQKVDVTFCGGLWEACLANATNSDLIVKSVEGDKICLIDPTTNFVRTYEKCLSKKYAGWELVSNDTFCVNKGEISQLSQNGSRIWGDNSAICKGIDKARDR